MLTNTQTYTGHGGAHKTDFMDACADDNNSMPENIYIFYTWNTLSDVRQHCNCSHVFWMFALMILSYKSNIEFLIFFARCVLLPFWISNTNAVPSNSNCLWCSQFNRCLPVIILHSLSFHCFALNFGFYSWNGRNITNSSIQLKKINQKILIT